MTTSEQDQARMIAALEHLKHPFDRKQISKLPATDKRPALDYVNHAHVTNRLNQYAPDCSWTVDATFAQDGEFWVRGTMTIYGVSRVEFGKGKNPLEAMSHYIRRAAMRFGVATDLWAKEDFEDLETSGPAPSGPVEGAPTGEGYGEGSEPVGALASPEQWERLVTVAGSLTRAVNRLNRVNKSKARPTYLKAADAKASATEPELADAILGDA